MKPGSPDLPLRREVSEIRRWLRLLVSERAATMSELDRLSGPMDTVCLERSIGTNIVVRTGVTCLARNPELADGIEAFVDDAGELYVL